MMLCFLSTEIFYQIFTTMLFLCTGEGVKWNPNSMSRVVPRHVKTTCDQLSAHTSASSGTTNNLERHKSQSDSCVSVKVRPANL